MTMLFNAMLFIGFIALNIASSSVTIRVEMRWIYVSLTGALLFPFLYLWGADRRSKKRTVSEETLAMGDPFWAVCAAYASGRTVLPQLLSKAVSVAGPAAL